MNDTRDLFRHVEFRNLTIRTEFRHNKKLWMKISPFQAMTAHGDAVRIAPQTVVLVRK